MTDTRIGVHVGIGDGHEKAVAYARGLGCGAVQFFSGNPRSYGTPTIDPEKLAAFARMRAEAAIERSVIHTSYLINFASEDPKIVNNSVRLVRHDLAFAGAGEIDYVNTHLGSYGKRDRAEGFAAVLAALERVLEDIPPKVRLVLENSAGAGNLCGGTIEELGALVRALAHPQLGICIDTAHAWASGYDLSSAEGVEEFFALVAREVPSDAVAMFHFNDTKVPLGGKKDRHWHIGDGLIGATGFSALLERPEVRGGTVILETPGDDADDARNMETLRTMIAGKAA